MKEYEGNMKKHEEFMKEYEENMKKYERNIRPITALRGKISTNHRLPQEILTDHKLP